MSSEKEEAEVVAVAPEGDGSADKSNKNAADGADIELGDDGLPAGVKPFFVTTSTQELFECVVDEHVSLENRLKYIPLAKIKEDMIARAAVSDFSAVKEQLLKYDGDDVLLIFDDFEHGENFLICLTEKGKAAYLKMQSAASAPEEGTVVGEDGEIVVGEQQAEEDILLLKKKRLPQKWVSLGSEKEIDEAKCIPTRKRMCYLFSRKRRLFGAPVTLADAVVAENREFPPATEYKAQQPLEDAPPPVHRRLVDRVCQAVPETATAAAQTTWYPKKNASSQWQPQRITKDAEASIDMDDLSASLNRAFDRLKDKIQANAIMNVYADDFMRLKGKKSVAVSSKAASLLKDFQTFKHMGFGKTRNVSHMDFHPTFAGIIAVCYTKNLTFVDLITKVDPTEKNMVFIWSLSDPISPKVTLLAPDEVLSVRFCPTNPNYIAAGLRNGQVVFWDLGKAGATISPFYDSSQERSEVVVHDLTPIVKSDIEAGHKAAVTALHWLPSTYDVSATGRPADEPRGSCCQFITCAADGQCLIWDIQPEEKDAPIKSLDLKWAPRVQVYLTADGMPAVLAHCVTLYQTHANLAAERAIEPAEFQPSLLISTITGEVLHISMERPVDANGKMAVQKPDLVLEAHGGETLAVERSPFFPELYLSIGGTTMSLWKGNCKTPLLQYRYPCASSPSAISWSLHRPCVWFVAKKDGFVDSWDLTDSSYRPTLSHAISAPVPITTMQAGSISYPLTSGMASFLGVGDESGTAHMVELPTPLTTPVDSEVQLLKHFVDREMDRIAAGNTSTITSIKMKKYWLEALEEPSAEELKDIIANYLKEEDAFLIDLGLKTPEEDDDGDS